MSNSPASKPRRPAGSSLVELLVALVLFSIISLAVTTALITSQRASASNQRLMHAVLLAADALERARSRRPLPPAADHPRFTSTTILSAAGQAGLRRAAVDVQWNDSGERSLTLTTLIWWPEDLAPPEERP